MQDEASDSALGAEYEYTFTSACTSRLVSRRQRLRTRRLTVVYHLSTTCIRQQPFQRIETTASLTVPCLPIRANSRLPI